MTAKKRILLVDDEKRFTRALTLNLEKSGLYAVREENNPANAIAAAREFQPDLVLLDIMMPELAGDELAAQFKSDPNLEHIPIVFLTAVASREEVRGFDGVIGGYAVLAKPVSVEEVMKCIGKHLGVTGQSVASIPPPSFDARPAMPSGPLVPKKLSHSTRDMIISLLAFLLVAGGYLSYRLYHQSQRALQDTLNELRSTRTKMSALSSSSELANRQTVSLKQPAHHREEPSDQQAALPAAQSMHKPAKVNLSDQGGRSRLILSRFAASVVKLMCRDRADSNEMRRGSGILYRTGSNHLEMGPYHVQTSLHVVQTTDGSEARCMIYLYPDLARGDVYLSYESRGFRFYRNDIDVAFLEPKLSRWDTHAGSMMDLSANARDESKSPFCNTAEIGDRMSILGYPGAGGDTLTATEGIISGFEFDGANRYIKSSAKLDRGNSGGAAIKDSGCVVGIPSFVQRGQLETIGRILDLSYLYSVTLN